MPTDDVKEAAERLREMLRRIREENCDSLKCISHYPGETIEERLAAYNADERRVRDAYLTEHPADDDEPVTEEWYREIWDSLHAVSVSQNNGFLYLPVIKLDTRGQVRRLLAALKGE